MTDFLAVSFSAVPPIGFAHGYRTGPNTWTLGVNPGNVEIVFIEQGPLLSTSADKTERLLPGLHCVCHDRERRIVSADPVHQHYTLMFSLPEKPAKLCADDRPRLLGGAAAAFTAILPEHLTDSPLCGEIARDIKAVITAHAEPDGMGRLKAGYLLFKILYRLHAYSIEQEAKTGNSPFAYGNPYCRKAMRYAAEHLEEKISVQEVADALGISYGHLSRLMKAHTGTTMVDYINRLKLERVKELLLSKNLSLEEAGLRVGIEDVKYLSRLFKKQNGVTATEFRRFHNNPAG